jgi:hypothetical protein
MAKVRVDFSDVESFEAIPDGEYPVVIVSAVLKESQRSEHPYINLEMDVAEGEHEGRKLWSILSLHPKALFRTKENFENLGVYQDEIDLDVDDDTGDVLEPELVGLPAVAVVTSQEYEGKLRNRVDLLLPSDGNGPKKSTTAKRPGSGNKKTAGAKTKTAGARGKGKSFS